jgi:two-component system, LytTR family, response regulator
MFKTILIDDDESNLSSLSEKLSRNCPELKVLAKCVNAGDGIKAIESDKPDIVFLDIEMPVMNGFLMLQQLSYRDFALIFVTAYDHYAIRAIRYSALDYLVKPVSIEDLTNAVARAIETRKSRQSATQIELLLEYFTKKNSKRISIPTSEGLQFINTDEIVYLQASDNYTNIFLSNKQRLLVSRTLKSFEEILPADIFLRIHHGTVVNRTYVEKYIRGEGGQVVMREGSVLDVSKRKKISFLQSITEHGGSAESFTGE